MSDNKEDKLNHKKGSHFEFDQKEDVGRMPDPELQAIHDQLFREKEEPEEKDSPIPLLLLFLFGILIFWSGFYLARYSGGFKGDVFNPELQGGVAQAKPPAPFDPLVQGKKSFVRTCQACHQVDGKGLPGVYPPLAGSAWLLTSEERPIKILIKGMSGPIEVEGASFNNNMPPVGDWKDRDIAAVLTYARQAWGNSAGPISEELVKKVREEIKDQMKPWKPEEILAQHPL